MGYKVPGPCTVKYGVSAEFNLGVTKSGVIIRPNTGVVPITDDHRGAVPGAYIFGGKSCIVELTGMELSKLKDADIWDGGVLTQANQVGKLASAASKKLRIEERAYTAGEDLGAYWLADLAFPTDPRAIGLRSTSEIAVPLVFVIIVSAGKLFSHVPSYIQT